MGYIKGKNRYQVSILPPVLDDYVAEDSEVTEIYEVSELKSTPIKLNVKVVHTKSDVFPTKKDIKKLRDGKKKEL